MATDATKETQEQEGAVEQSLENFDWDTTGEGNFFGIDNSAVEKDEVAEIVENVKKEDETEEEEEETNETDSFFETESESEEGTDDDDPIGGDYYSNLTAKMKERGIFQNIEISEDETLDEEKFIEFQDKEIDARVDEALEGFLEDLDEDGAEFLKFKKNGGKTEDFFKVYKESLARPTGDLDDESHQEKVARYYYKNVDNLDEEDINDKIEWLKDSGKLAKYAEKHDSKLEALDKKKQEDLQTSAKQQEQAAEEARKKFVDSVQEALDNTDEVDNFVFKDKKGLHAFITKPSIKVSKNRYVTGMQAKLQEVLKSPEKMLVLAKLLKDDFDVSGVVEAGTTKQTQKIKDDVQRSKGSKRPLKSGKTNKKRNLADFF